MKRSPLWLKFFVVSLMLMLIIVLAMTFASVIQMRGKENNIVRQNIANSMSYTEHNIKNVLSGYTHQIGSQQTARSIYAIKSEPGDYRDQMRKKIAELSNEGSEVFAVFYCDNNGVCYSAGEIFGSIDSQISIINECKSKPEWSKGEGVWQYAPAGRGKSSLIWCKDIIYVDDIYNQTDLGTVILYLDAKKISAEFFDGALQTQTAVSDGNGVIAIAVDESLIGKKMSDVFDYAEDGVAEDGEKSYIYEKHPAYLQGWEIMTYIDEKATGRNVAKTMTATIMVALFGFSAVLIISYMLSKRLGRPIEELLAEISVNGFGEIDKVHGGDENDIAKIRSAFDALGRELKENIESNYEMQIRLKEITIKAYESQINPHFLFNTLYMIQMMNVLGEKENVTAITNHLGKLLRFNLDAKNEVPLHAEIENVENYLGIMQLRFKGRFNYRIIIPPELMDCYAAKFMLQPLIENSVSHGFAQKKDTCEIVIAAHKFGEDIAIVIKDNGQGITPERLKTLKEKLAGKGEGNDGLGIVNVHERIKLLYGEKYGVDVFSDYGKNTNVLIHIPVSKAPKKEADEDV